MLISWIRGFLLAVIISLNYGRTNALRLDELKYYEIVEPHHVRLDGVQRNRRDLSTNVDNGHQHLHETEFTFSGHGRNFTLHIYKNTFLIPDSFATIYQGTNGSYLHNHTVEHCYYHGYLRDRTISSAVVSTCSGLKGIIKDEDDEEFVIQPHPTYDDVNIDGSSKYILYNSKDVINDEKVNCGADETVHKRNENYPSKKDGTTMYEGEHRNDYEASKGKSSLTPQTQREHHRSRRAHVATKYVELLAVVDKTLYSGIYRTSGGSQDAGLRATQTRVLEVINYVDAIYKMITTRVVVVNLIIWHVKNMSPVTDDRHVTLRGFSDYSEDVLRREMNLKFDHAHLMLDKKWGDVIGLAYIGTMCKAYASTAMSRVCSSCSATFAANTVAHELGHAMGFIHNYPSCTCTTRPCVMDAELDAYSLSNSFSSCTLYTLKVLLRENALYCLFTYPHNFYGDAVCGNGLLEDGEACDCGNEAECRANNGLECCDFETCTLKVSADCAVGPCCHNCKFKERGVVCRSKRHHECDLEEHCTGESEHCPDNFYPSDGGSCDNGASYCYKGGCRSHDAQCEMLWGPAEKKADDRCFDEHRAYKSIFQGCGKKDSDGWYIKCSPQDKLCGKLQCTAKSAAINTHPGYRQTINPFGMSDLPSIRSISCTQGISKTKDIEDDLTFTQSGAKCADNSICLSRKCVKLSTLDIKRCDKMCLNGGVCNNNGHCHCPSGFACPYCEFRGESGSIDSGAECVYSDRCNVPAVAGNCTGELPRYYYDAGSETCKRFVYSGCHGNDNRFDSEDKCMKACANGNWGPWSTYGTCSATCGSGTRERSRPCNNPAPTSGGLTCSGQSTRRIKCKVLECKGWEKQELIGSGRITKNNTVTVLDTIDKEYRVEVKFWPINSGSQSGWRNVIRFTVGDEDPRRYPKYGDYIVAVWYRATHNSIRISSTVNGNRDLFIISRVFSKRWNTIEVSQQKQGEDYHYSTAVNGVIIGDIVNSKPEVFRNVKIYASDPWFPAQTGYISGFDYYKRGVPSCYNPTPALGGSTCSGPEYTCRFALGHPVVSVITDIISTNDLRGDECIKGCVHEKWTRDSLNGVALPVNSWQLAVGTQQCYCVLNMSSIESSTQLKTCFLVPTLVRFPNQVNRRENGSTSYVQGHVEIFHDNRWGTICEDEFDNNDANVLCKMAGYRSGEYNPEYKQPTATKADQIWLDDVQCTGNELNIDACSHRDWGSNNCDHGKDVGIRCYYNGWVKNELIESQIWISEGNVVTVLESVRKEYRVVVEFLPKAEHRDTTNVIRFAAAIGRNLNLYAEDRGGIVATMWYHNQVIRISSTVNGNRFEVSVKLSRKNWHTVEVTQEKKGEAYRYSVVVDGVVIGDIVNNRPQIFRNVRVYASDPWSPNEEGFIKRLDFYEKEV